MAAEAPRTLVTGASGFLGAHLVAALHRRGHAVTAVVRAGSDLRRLTAWAGPVAPVVCDLADHDALTRLIARTGPQTIFHLAGDTSVRHFTGDWGLIDRAIAANMTAALAVLRAAMAAAEGGTAEGGTGGGGTGGGGTVRRIIRTGGIEEYGTGPSPADEAQREAPVSPYSASQVAVTQWYAMLQAHTPIMLTTLRPALIYGPDQDPAFLIPALIRALLDGQRFAMGDGRQRRDVLHVDDMIRAFLLTAARDDLRGAVINISSGAAVPMGIIARQIAALLGAEDRLDIGARPPRPVDIAVLAASNALAARLIGWKPQIALAEGLARTVAWHRARG